MDGILLRNKMTEETKIEDVAPEQEANEHHDLSQRVLALMEGVPANLAISALGYSTCVVVTSTMPPDEWEETARAIGTAILGYLTDIKRVVRAEEVAAANDEEL
jgi:hypothetical protein